MNSRLAYLIYKKHYAILKLGGKRTTQGMGYTDPKKAAECSNRSYHKRYPVNPEMRRKAKENAEAWQAEHPEEAKAASRKSRLKKLGWSPEAVENAKAMQNDRCAICNEITELVPDHEHSDPPKPRQMLCRSCNVGIGAFKDSTEICEAAAAYLRHWNKPCKNCGMCLDCIREERG
jgi:hypothetical protein